MRIYGSRFSPRARRAAIAAVELGLDVELVELNPGQGDNRTEAYLAKNPMGKIPTFEDDDGWVLWESCAILCYLAEQRPHRKLFPTEPRAKAEALRWLFWGVGHLDSSAGPLYSQRYLGARRGQAPDPAIVEPALKELARFLPVLETHLADRHWVLGEHFSLVDVALGTAVDAILLEEVGFDGTPYPRILAWRSRLVMRDSWKTWALS